MSEFRLRDIAIVILFVGLALVVAYLLPGCKAQDNNAAQFRAAFEEAAPKPAWVNCVEYAEALHTNGRNAEAIAALESAIDFYHGAAC